MTTKAAKRGNDGHEEERPAFVTSVVSIASAG